MSRFYLLPTTDIHLVLDEAVHDGQQFVLKFNYRGQISGFEPSKVSKCVEKPSIIDVDIDYDPNDTVSSIRNCDTFVFSLFFHSATLHFKKREKPESLLS